MNTNTHTKTSMHTSAEQAAVAELVKWVRDHDGHVDHDAFREACDRVLHLALRISTVRVPRGLPRGLPRVDFALALLREFGPLVSEINALAHDYPRLPGAKWWRKSPG